MYNSVMDALEQVGPKRVPEAGEHSEEIPASLGYSNEAIEALRERGVIQ